MSIENLKKMKNEKGFTIVELLIVIVVIGILAAIIIAAYQGVTKSANATKAQTNASTVQKKVEAYNADASGGNGQYPASAAAIVGLAQTALGAVPTSITVSKDDPTVSNSTTNVRYVSCTVSSSVVGYYIDYFDQAKNKLVYIVGGTTIVANSDNTVAPTTTGCTLSTT